MNGYFGIESLDYEDKYNNGFIVSDPDITCHQSLEDLFGNPEQLNNLLSGPSELIDEKKFSVENKLQTENKHTANTSLVKKDEENIVNSINNIVTIDILPKTEKKEPKSFLGRKTKGDTEEREHSKFKEDNQMRKIKSYFLKYIPDYINSSLSFVHKRFLKIDKKVNQELKKDFNVELMDKKLKDIFIEFPICGRYSEAKNGENHNAELIKEIYENNEETEAIEKLEQIYIQVLDCFRKNNLEKFRDDILNKEIKNGEKESRAKMYVNQLVKLLFNYESWFTDKSARGPKKSLLKEKGF
jgi:hypothetical protein